MSNLNEEREEYDQESCEYHHGDGGGQRRSPEISRERDRERGGERERAGERVS